MVSKVYVLYDAKMEIYQQPFLALNRGHAVRMVCNLLRENNSNVAQYPEDFTLFEIGEYNDETASYTQKGANVSLGNVLEYKSKDIPS